MKRVITVVRFSTHIALGTGLEMQGSIQNGQLILGVPTSIEFDMDPSFLCLSFNGKNKDQKYKQLIPISQCATIMYQETK